MTKEQQNVIKARNKGGPKCTYCQQPGHAEIECRTLKQDILMLKKSRNQKTVAHTTITQEIDEDDKSQEADSVVYAHTTESVLTTGVKPLSEDLVLIDHCASASIFNNKNLLSNIRRSSTITFTGIGGSIDVTQEGDFGDFGTVAYDVRASFNILSVDSTTVSRGDV